MAATALTTRKETLLGWVTPILGRMVGERAFSLPADLTNQSRVLVVDSGDLTELLFFAPVLQRLKRMFPGMRITTLVRDGNSELIRTMDQISEMISYEPAHLSLSSTTYLSLLRRLKSRNFDIVFMLGRDFSFSRSLLTIWTRAKLRVGFAQEFSHPFLNCELRQANGADKYEADRMTGMLTALGLSPGDSIQGWSLPEQDTRWAEQMIRFRRSGQDSMIVAVDPGAGKGHHRLVEKTFAQVVEGVAHQFDAKLLVVSNNLDNKGLARFRSLLGADAIDVEAKNVKEGLALLSAADLILSGNTDYFHFAVRMRKPTVGFFTRHDARCWFPKDTPWVQIIQGVRGQKLSLDEVYSKIDTLLHLSSR